MKSVSEFRP